MKKEIELELNRYLNLWDLLLCSFTDVSESVKLGVTLRVVRLSLSRACVKRKKAERKTDYS